MASDCSALRLLASTAGRTLATALDMHTGCMLDTSSMYVKESGEQRTAAVEFVGFFAEGWAVGATDPERFFAHFGPRLAPDARMIQPLSRDCFGPEGLRELFAPLFRAIPDLRGEVVRSGETADGVVIELTLRGTLGGRPIEWTTVDRIVLRDGVIAERKAYFDPLPLALQLLSRPRASFKLLPAMFKRRETK